MRLAGIQQFLKERRLPFQYWEEDDCGSIEFDHRGLHYHIWENAYRLNSARYKM